MSAICKATPYFPEEPVFVALDTELDREVALKEIQQHLAHHESSRTRFLVEAEITGKLEHPGIVPVLV
jgi:eukaryotic-like serine/threonine-protein kinase